MEGGRERSRGRESGDRREVEIEKKETGKQRRKRGRNRPLCSKRLMGPTVCTLQLETRKVHTRVRPETHSTCFLVGAVLSTKG